MMAQHTTISAALATWTDTAVKAGTITGLI